MPAFAYLDHAASTPTDPRVVAAMSEALLAGGANPAAIHGPGRAAAARIEAARAQVAALVSAPARDLVFTSGATESNNLAILGHAQGWAAVHGRPGHLVSLLTEHKSVLAPLRRLRAQGWRVTLLTPGRSGLIAPQALATVLEPDTAMVSLLWVNNETGVIQDIPAIAELCRAHQVALHVDAAQAVGKLPVDAAGLDYLSFTAHKYGGPGGIGALVVAPTRRAQLAPQILGGGQEHGLRSGTPAEHQITGFAAASRIAAAEGAAAADHMRALRDGLWEALSLLPGAELNGEAAPRVCGILNVTFRGIEGESLAAGIAGNIAVSPGSACDSASGEPSFVLRAMGRDREEAQSSLRFSLAPSTTAADIDVAVTTLRREHARLAALSPAAAPPVADWLAAGARVVLGEAGEVRTGTWVRWHWRLEGERVAEARFQVHGCPTVLAAMQHVAAQLPGLAPGAPLPGAPADWLQAVNGPVEKLGRMLIIEDAARATLSSWQG